MDLDAKSASNFWLLDAEYGKPGTPERDQFDSELGDGKVEKFDKTVHFKRNKTAVLSLNPAKEAEVIFKMEDSELEDDIDTLLLKTKEWYMALGIFTRRQTL